ncbi:hypothetical protein ACHAQH_002942 [Verticillium albo-atrum]
MNYPSQDQPGSVKPSLLRTAQTAGRPKPRPAQQSSHPVPFDPEDLSRRLSVVLAQQKAHADRKRASRTDPTRRANLALGRPSASSRTKDASPTVAAAAALRTSPPTKADDPAAPALSDDNGSYIPRVAAAQFARTTTAADMAHHGLAHKLSRKAISRSHRAAGADPGAAMPLIPSQNPLAVVVPRTMTSAELPSHPARTRSGARRSHAHREKADDRQQSQHNQNLQRDRILEAAAVAGDFQGRNPQRHTIEGPLALAGIGGPQTTDEQQGDDATTRRVSMSDLLGRPHPNEVAAAAAADEPEVPPHDVNEHRVDWTQSDERPKTRSTPLIRKADSIWTLRGRLGSLGKSGRDDKATSIEGESPKSPKVGFFARFKVSH